VTTSTANHKAYFDAPGNYSATGSFGSPLVLTFPKLPMAYSQVSPEATVTVTLDGTTVSRTVAVRQNASPPRQLVFQSNARTGYGSLASNPSHENYFNAFNYVLRDGISFAPSGVVRTAGAFAFTVGSIPASSATVYNANVESINATARGYVRTWMSANPANFLMVVNDNVHGANDREALLRLFSTAYNTASVSNSIRTMASRPSGLAAQKVWDYIMVNGPFGAVYAGTTFTTDGYTRALTTWPSTTVPLLYGAGYPQVAIDPVLRILYIGDVDLFGTVGGRNSFPAGSAKLAFMNNIIAFMVNAAQYGDYFLSEFR
jgi:hypothetical protein